MDPTGRTAEGPVPPAGLARARRPFDRAPLGPLGPAARGEANGGAGLRGARRLRTAIVAGAALLLQPGAVDAQVPGLPPMADPFVASPGVDRSISATVGGAAARTLDDGVWSLVVARRYLLTPTFSLEGTVGASYTRGSAADGPVRPLVALNGELVLTDEALTVGLLGGVGWADAPNGNTLLVPLGVGLTRFIPVLPTGVEPLAVWAYPRFELQRHALGGSSDVEASAAISFGLAAGLSGGLAVQLGADLRRVPDPPALVRIGLPSWSLALRVRLRSRSGETTP